jgi:hypothetical protein
MKFSKVFLAAFAALSLSTAATVQAAGAHIDEGAVQLPVELESAVLAQLARIKKGEASVRAVSVEDAQYIDMTVFMHPTYLDYMAKGYTKRPDGRNWENGMQFILERINAQVSNMNAVFEMQNVNARLRINYVGTVNIDIDPLGNKEATEHITMIKCVYFFDKDYSQCADKEPFKREGRIVSAETDLLYYLRPFNEQTDYALGHGGFTNAVSVYDNYSHSIQGAKNTGSSALDSLRFGNLATQVFGHEMGHFLGGNHNIGENETIGSRSDAAYGCGKRDQANAATYVKGDVKTMKKTVLHATLGSPGDEHHLHFSDPDISIEGDACGVIGEANNIAQVRKYAPIFAKNRDPVADLSDIGFALDQQVVTRSESAVTLTVRRTGDLSKPTFATLVARDGSAWEGRDFTFGLKELAFEAGESEKSVSVSILPRSGKHPDTTFNVDIKYAIGSAIQYGSSEVKIVSVNKPDYGVVSLASNLSVTEKATAIVTLTRTNGTDGAVDVKLSTIDGTALAGVDYTALDTVVRFADGQATTTANIAITDRTGAQGSRSFSVKLSNAQGGLAIGTNDTITVMISDAAAPATPDSSGGSSGGSMGWFTLLAGLLALRSRASVK